MERKQISCAVLGQSEQLRVFATGLFTVDYRKGSATNS